MALPDIFSKDVCDTIVARVNKLTPQSASQWGKMNVAQILAHSNVTYELVYTNKHKTPGMLMKFILKSFIKKNIVNEVPYKNNLRTAPAFIIADEREFNTEKKRLLEFIDKTRQLGRSHFEGKESHSFGKLTAQEWNNLFYKHLDHHLTQFGA